MKLTLIVCALMVSGIKSEIEYYPDFDEEESPPGARSGDYPDFEPVETTAPPSSPASTVVPMPPPMPPMPPKVATLKFPFNPPQPAKLDSRGMKMGAVMRGPTSSFSVAETSPNSSMSLTLPTISPTNSSIPTSARDVPNSVGGPPRTTTVTPRRAPYDRLRLNGSLPAPTPSMTITPAPVIRESNFERNLLLLILCCSMGMFIFIAGSVFCLMLLKK